ncbi:hypothetical protein LCGC14_1843540, partial [marine sediment metagenome]
MKNFLFIIILMLGISINSISQTIVLLAKYGEITYNESWNDAEMVDLQEEEIILTFNGDTHIIEISNNFRDKFIYYTEESEKIIDETGHSLITFYYEVVDKNGSDCLIAVQYYEDNYLFGGECIFRIRIAYA